jgi:hypothetical protein
LGLETTPYGNILLNEPVHTGHATRLPLKKGLTSPMNG